MESSSPANDASALFRAAATCTLPTTARANHRPARRSRASPLGRCRFRGLRWASLKAEGGRQNELQGSGSQDFILPSSFRLHPLLCAHSVPVGDSSPLFSNLTKICTSEGQFSK